MNLVLYSKTLEEKKTQHTHTHTRDCLSLGFFFFFFFFFHQAKSAFTFFFYKTNVIMQRKKGTLLRSAHTFGMFLLLLLVWSRWFICVCVCMFACCKNASCDSIQTWRFQKTYIYIKGWGDFISLFCVVCVQRERDTVAVAAAGCYSFLFFLFFIFQRQQEEYNDPPVLLLQSRIE